MFTWDAFGRPTREGLRDGGATVKALVTGGDGFVGRHLLEHLRAHGDEAIGVDRECDVTDAASVRAVLERVRPDAIYHLAALTAVGASWSDPVEYTRVNVLGTQNVLDAAHDVVPPASVVVVSSADVYGVVRPEDLPLVEIVSRSPGQSLRVEQGRGRTRGTERRARARATRTSSRGRSITSARVNRPTSWCRRS